MFGNSADRTSRKGFRRGDVVTVRSLEEILATLDGDAKCEGVPFMPEMVPFCGKTFTVYRRANKTCVEKLGMRCMQNTVFLEGLRCDGSAHDGCQRGCLFFWKEAWLKGVSGSETPGVAGSETPVSERAMSTWDRETSAAPANLPTRTEDRFYCQSTELASATSDFPAGKLRHYWRDVRTGELTLRRFAYFLWMALTNRVWRLFRGRTFYQLTGEQKKTLTEELDLQPGELVEIKSPAEIEATLDTLGRNRGLSFDPEMAIYCGRRYRVATPVRSIVLEETGKMARLSNTVILDGLTCQGICSKNCPRANYLYWREIWLKRVKQ
jgi:hypothetical protein